MTDTQSPAGSSDRRTLLKGIAAGFAGSAVSYVGLDELVETARAHGWIGEQARPDLTRADVDRGFDRLNGGWDRHVEDAGEILTQCLGVRQVLDLTEEKFGAEGRREMLATFADAVSPFHYDRYERIYGRELADVGREDADRFDALYARVSAADTIAAATEMAFATESRTVGLERGAEPKARAPAELSTHRKTVQAVDPLDPKVFGWADETTILATDQNEIPGTTVQSADPATVNVTFDPVEPVDKASFAQGGITLFVNSPDPQAPGLTRWFPVFVDFVDLTEETTMQFHVAVDHTDITAWRAFVFGRGIEAATLKHAWIRGQG